MKRLYLEKNFFAESMEIINTANRFIGEYQAQGFNLTLRQLFYQFVAEDLIKNSERSYRRLGTIISGGRLAGLIDWDSIKDRTRSLEAYRTDQTPFQTITTAANRYQIDMWEKQESYVEVWVEKEALIDVVEKACNSFMVPHFACRGYVSQSAMWEAAQRMESKTHKDCLIIHLGDHDPSGIDMTRDIRDRMELFECHVNVDRIAMNMDWIKSNNPPPNPAKVTDSRADNYIKKYGNKSWELDAIKPGELASMIATRISYEITQSQWDKDAERQENDKHTLMYILKNWHEIIDAKDK